VISSTADGFDAQLAAAERYLDELDRKTYSNFSVTNPTTGVKNLEVGPVGDKYQVRLRDSNGNVIYGNHLNPDIGIDGFRMPMPMYPSIPYTGGFTATTSTWVTMYRFLTMVNSSGIQVAYRYGDQAPAGGTLEARVQYNIGGGPITITDSVVTAVGIGHAITSFAFTWPADIFDIQVEILLQARMATGSGAALASPMYFLGGTA
jgi:hypothetical protein